MLQSTKATLDKYRAFETSLPSFLQELVETIPNPNIPYKMKLAIAVSELVTFTSQFRRNINVEWTNSSIPINAITFILSHSGSGKDSSVNMMRKNFEEAYTYIDELRKTRSIERAITEARKAGDANPTSPKMYKQYLSEPNPLFVSPSTLEGFIQHLNSLDEDNIGSSLVYSGEIGGELENSSVIIQMLQILSELYDEGKKEVKVLKDKTKQSKAIKNLPVHGLFVGTKDQIVYNEPIKKKFKTEFDSKLARRSFFCFNTETPPQLNYDNPLTYIEKLKELEDEATKRRIAIQKYTLELAKNQIALNTAPIEIDEDARNLYLLYLTYNTELSRTIDRTLSISILTRQHLHWKALKLAGALTIYKGLDVINALTYKEAMTYCELLANDISVFEVEMNKEDYELFATYAKEVLGYESSVFFSAHELKKLGYIKSTQIENQIKNLVTLASSYDKDNIYVATPQGIQFTRVEKDTDVSATYLKVEGTKQERSKNCSEGFESKNVPFEHLAILLRNSFAYTPFKFKNGKRKSENVYGGIKWLAFDIDEGEFTDEEMHELLREYNHHIARTSNAENPYKYRILLEISSVIELDEKQYKIFMREVAKELLIPKIDQLARSQIYFGYKGRNVLSVTDKSPYNIKNALLIALNEANQPSLEKKSVSLLRPEQRKALIDDPYGTFFYAYTSEQGSGSLNLIRASKHARDLGMTTDEIIDLVTNINNYWEYPMEPNRFEKTILKQIREWN